MGIDASFGAPFAEQLEFFRAKLNLPTARWDDIMHAAHDRAFVVAGAAKADLLADLRGAVDRAIAKGEGIEAFRQRFFAIAEQHGWAYTGMETAGGRDWRTRVIYQTNMATSHAAGRYHQLTDPRLLARRPYWRYIHNDSVAHPRPLHKQWGDMGLTLRHDDPFWRTHFPPNGWGCRCRVKAVRAPEGDDATAPPAGWDEINPKTGAPFGIDKGFAYAPGASTAAELRQFAEQKARTLPPEIGRAFRQDVARQAGKRSMRSEEVATRLGDLREPALTPVERTARDHVVEQGKATGHEHGVAIRDGKIVEKFSSNAPNRLVVPAFDAAVDVHHNHSLGDSLSPADLMLLLKRDDIATVFVHGHEGATYSARRLGAVRADAKAVVATAMAEAVEKLRAAVDAGVVSRRDAESGLKFVVAAVLLDRAGVLAYTFNSPAVLEMAKKVANL